MSASLITRSLGLFILAGLCEIGGGWLSGNGSEGRPWSWGCVLSSLWCGPHAATRSLRSRLCSLRRVFHCAVSFVGLDFRQQSAG